MSRRLSTAAVLAAFALAACAGDATTPNADPTGDATPTATGTVAPTTTSSPTASATPAATKARVPVYYLGGTEDRPVLYREFRSVPVTGGAVVRAAVDAMLHLAPADDDYHSLWPAKTTVRGVSVSGSVATVDLSANARSVSTTRVKEQASLQQLVHTVTATAPAIKSVRLRFDGDTAPTLWGRVDTTGALTRAASVDTIAPIWVIEPAQDARVSRTFTVKGTATVFEATVTWSVTRPGGTTALANGFVTATKGAPERGDFTVKVTLPAGTTGDIVFTAWESSAEDGRVTHADSKTYRVA